MNKLDKISKLLRVKRLRSKLAEMEVAKARRFVMEAEGELARSRDNEIYIRETSAERRQNRLEELLQGEGNIPIRNVRLANIYSITNQEITESQDATKAREGELQNAEDRAKLEQSKLAHFLQVEERTNKLCERLEKIQRVEAARKV